MCLGEPGDSGARTGRLFVLEGDLTAGLPGSSCDFCFFKPLAAAFEVAVGLDFVLRCPFLAGLAFNGLSLSLSEDDGNLDLPPAFAESISNKPLRKSGSPRSSDSSFRSPAAPSRRAWLVFSIAFLSPISDLVQNIKLTCEDVD